MPIQVVTKPQDEPITLAEAKLHLRVDEAVLDDDTWINDAIQAAREDAEFLLRRAFITQTWNLFLDTFPFPGTSIAGAYYMDNGRGVSAWPMNYAGLRGRTGMEIYVPFPPLQSITSITYVDTSGATQTLASNQYLVDTASEPARVTPAYGTTWPGTRTQVNAVTVQFACGYGVDGNSIPAGIKRWIKLRVATLYENREEVALLNRGKIEQLPYVDGLLDAYQFSVPI